MKTYTIIAGVNGAGKSTFYLLDRQADFTLKNSQRISPDEILVKQGGDWRSNLDQAKAAKTAARLLKNCINANDSFHRETTLAGGSGSHIQNIKRAKANGFYIHLVYVALSSVDLAKERIKLRVSKGGHGIPDAIVEKRYFQSLSNLSEIMPFVDETEIYDNSGSSIQLVYSSKSNQKIFDHTEDFPYLKQYIIVK